VDQAIKCRGLVKTYEGGVEAVRGIDLDIGAGECFGLLGPNGAGKTTTIEILEGLLGPTAGDVEILGMTWREHDRDLRELLGISLQETRLSEKLTVRETVSLFAHLYDEPADVDEVIAELSLTEKASAWVGKLSGGQRQRLAVATALVGNPKILFLDEPTTGLDPQSRRQLWDIVRQFQSRGGTVLLTTHYMDEAERLCDRIAIIDHGKTIAMGTPEELIARLGGHHVVEFAVGSSDPTLRQTRAKDGAPGRPVAGATGRTEAGAPQGLDGHEWQKLPGVESVRAENGSFALTVGEPAETIPALLAAVQKRGERVVRLTTRQCSLEDVFVSLTGRHLREE